ncbi:MULTISPECIES: hypothetical protein [Bradyrhizobium]|jgi:hypothetical protein|uniref:Uncharacterized protein n=2 Tax=Bradyrhizobium TaxID=374 RepID=A0ABY0QDW8_9BRAD|nr:MULTISPECIES: hypothetical protein [Bradyrhizobium]SDK00842.1 hypothetical protein SAMN05444163_6984 [Bradyrhizobium ottawaense]SEB89599.1 hypothetical protein SAMN05444171_0173 [Bradyrhizobium lablabi]SHM61431.1 hypothetical protein SAMN05444321_6952 [Bradyrhizobium lablabi]
MNWAWASSLDDIWRSPTFPMWLTLAAAGFFGIIVLITLLRAEKSVANGALTVITLLAIAVAVAATIRGFGPVGQPASAQARNVQPVRAGLPQLSCIDDLAGDAVLNACEKALFGSAESSAAAVAYAASLITQLAEAGDTATVGKNPSSEFLALRRAIERDRYGLMAYVLMARDHCTPQACPVFRSLADSRQLAGNMDDRVYENLITRYAPSWNAPIQAGAGVVAALPPSMPTGKPTNAEFPTAASTPAVSIMAPEPGPGAAKPAAAAATGATAPRPAASPAPAAPKKQAAAKRVPPAAPPVQIAPAAPAPAAAPANE